MLAAGESDPVAEAEEALVTGGSAEEDWLMTRILISERLVAALLSIGAMGASAAMNPARAADTPAVQAPATRTPVSGPQAAACPAAPADIDPATIGVIEPRPAPCLPPALGFSDSAGAATSLTAFHGKPMIVNLWATWCAPCVKEMASLDALAGQLGSAGLAVVAVNQDTGGVDGPVQFLKTHSLGHLPLYTDPAGTVAKALQAPALPLTVLIDRDGNEVATLLGPADWRDPKVVASVETLLKLPVKE